MISKNSEGMQMTLSISNQTDGNFQNDFYIQGYFIKGIYFVNLIQQIKGCEAYFVGYSQPILYTKYRGMKFSDQKIFSNRRAYLFLFLCNKNRSSTYNRC
jgi:hypothetical protein